MFTVIGALFINSVMIFGVDDGLAAGFSWGVFWITAGFIGLSSYVTLVVIRERIEVAERAVYHRAWGWVQRRYPVEEISNFKKKKARVVLHLRSG